MTGSPGGSAPVTLLLRWGRMPAALPPGMGMGSAPGTVKEGWLVPAVVPLREVSGSTSCAARAWGGEQGES